MSSIDVFSATCPACGKIGGHKVSLPVDAATSWECECGHWWEVTVEVEGIANVALVRIAFYPSGIDIEYLPTTEDS